MCWYVDSYLHYGQYLFLPDINECSTGAFVCLVNSHCNNTIGGYTCVCNPGYSGDACVGML